MKYYFPFKRVAPLQCVYRITFNDQWFYIGSTKNLRARIGAFKAAFKASKCNKNIDEKCSNIKSVEVIELIKDTHLLKAREEYHLRLHSADAFIVNRLPTAFSNKGIKWDFRDKKFKNGIYDRPVVNRERYKINHFFGGSLIATYKNLKSASLLSGLSMATICKSSNNKSSNRWGHYFKKASPTDVIKIYSDPKVVKRKPKLIKEFIRRNDINMGQVIEMFVNGVSLNKIARVMNAAVNTIKYKLIKIDNLDYHNKKMLS